MEGLDMAEQQWVTEFAEHGASSEFDYNELDQKAGDGDFGTNLALGGRGVRARLARGGERPFTSLSRVFLDDIGGSSGPLFGLLFSNIERATAEELSARTLAEGARAGRDAIVRVGHAQLGDKTMVDSLTPIVEALEKARTSSTREALNAAAEAGRAGAEKTRKYRARRGRASYVGERAVGAIDPGALAIARFFAIGAAVFSRPTQVTIS